MAENDKKVKATEAESESLLAEIATLKAQLADKDVQLETAAQLEAGFAKSLKEQELLIEGLSAEIAKLKPEADKVIELKLLNDSLEEAITAQAAEIENLKAQLATPAKSGRPVSLAPKEFELDGKTYPFPAPAFFLEGFGRVTAEAALETPEILRRLVDVGAGKID